MRLIDNVVRGAVTTCSTVNILKENYNYYHFNLELPDMVYTKIITCML